MAMETVSSVLSTFTEQGILGIFKFVTISLKKLLKISQISFSLFMISSFSIRVIFSLPHALSEKEGFYNFPK